MTQTVNQEAYTSTYDMESNNLSQNFKSLVNFVIIDRYYKTGIVRGGPRKYVGRYRGGPVLFSTPKRGAWKIFFSI